MATPPQTFTWDDQEQKPPEQAGGFKWDDSSAPAAAAPAQPGFLESLGHTFGVGKEEAETRRQNLDQHPVRTILEDQPPVQAAEGLYQGGKRILGEVGQAIQAGREGNPYGAAQHAIQAVPFVGVGIQRGAEQLPAQPGIQNPLQPGVLGTVAGTAAQAAPAALGGYEGLRSGLAARLAKGAPVPAATPEAVAATTPPPVPEVVAPSPEQPGGPSGPGGGPAPAPPEPRPQAGSTGSPVAPQQPAGLATQAAQPGKPTLTLEHEPSLLDQVAAHTEAMDRARAETAGASPGDIKALRDAVEETGRRAHDAGDMDTAQKAAHADIALSQILEDAIRATNEKGSAAPPPGQAANLNAAAAALTGKPISDVASANGGFKWDDQKPAEEAPKPVTPERVAAILGTAKEQRPVVQASSNPEQIQKSAEEQKPALKEMAQAAVAGVPGAKVEGARVKDAESVANKDDRGKPPETITDHLGGRVSAPTPEAVQQVKQNIEQSLPIVGKDQIDNNGLNATQYAVQTGRPGDANQQSELQVVTTDQAKAMKDTDPLYEKQKEALARGDQKEADRLGAQIKEHFDAAQPEGQPAPAPLPDVIPKGTRVQLQDGRTGTVQWYDRTKQVARVKRDDGKEMPMVPRKALQAAPAAHVDAGPIGGPIPSRIKQIKDLVAKGTDVRIFSARVANDPEGKVRAELEQWSEKNLGVKLPITNAKDDDLAHILDDKANVTPNTNEPFQIPPIPKGKWLAVDLDKTLAYTTTHEPRVDSKNVGNQKEEVRQRGVEAVEPRGQEAPGGSAKNGKNPQGELRQEEHREQVSTREVHPREDGERVGGRAQGGDGEASGEEVGDGRARPSQEPRPNGQPLGKSGSDTTFPTREATRKGAGSSTPVQVSANEGGSVVPESQTVRDVQQDEDKARSQGDVRELLRKDEEKRKEKGVANAQSGNGGQPSAATAPKGAGGEANAVQKPSTARVLQREPEQDRSEGGGRVQPEQQGNGPAGESTAAGPGKEEAKPLGGAHGEQGSQGNAADEVKPGEPIHGKDLAAGMRVRVTKIPPGSYLTAGEEYTIPVVSKSGTVQFKRDGGAGTMESRGAVRHGEYTLLARPPEKKPKTFAEAVKAKKAKAKSNTLPGLSGTEHIQSNTPTLQGGPDRGVMESEGLRNALHAIAASDKSLREFDIPSQRLVMDYVISQLHDHEIRDAVVKFVPIDVVNNLARLQASAKVSLHDKPMLGNTPSVDLENPISIRMDTADRLVSAIAKAAAKNIGGPSPMGALPKNGDAALSAGVGIHEATIGESKEHVKPNVPPRYAYGNTQADIPPSSDAGKALAEVRQSIDPADLMGDGLEKDAHVTVRYGIQGEDTAGIKAFIEQQAPFDATLGPVAKFPPSEHSDGAAPLIAPVESPDLHKLNAEIEKHGDFTEPSFPEYKPHATVAYVKPEAADKYVGDTTTEGATFRVDSIDITDRDGNAEAVKLKGLAAGSVGKMPVRDLALDPRRFQYKLNTDASGVTNLLKGRKWNDDLAGVVTVWRDPANGRAYVVNGHHRVQLAKENGVKQITVRMIGGRSATEARAIGALQNIAEGRGTAIDAAKFFRDTGISPADLDEKGISLGEATAANGLALSRLAPKLFDDAVAGRLRVGRAIAIGNATEVPEQQESILKLIQRQELRGRRVPDDVVDELARMAKSAGEHSETQQTLFGAQEMRRNLALEKAEVSAYVRGQIAQEKRLFAGVSDENKAEKLGKAGNTINAAKNAEIAAQAAQAQELYDRLSTRTGEVDEALNQAASRLAKGDSPAGVKSDAYESIRQALSKTLGGRQEPSPERVQEDAGGPTLPGFEGAVREQRHAALEEQGRQLSAEMRQPPESIEKAAGEMERNSPLFSDSEANPQSNLFGGKPDAPSGWQSVGGPTDHWRDEVGQLSVEENAKRATARTLDPSGTDAGVVSLNHNAYAVVHNWLRVGSAHWNGITLGRDSVSKLVDDLARMAESSFDISVRRPLASIAKQIVEASRETEGRIILLAGDPPKITIDEEKFHAWQIANRIHLSRTVNDAVMSVQASEGIARRLTSMGYQPASIPSEIAAKAATGQILDLGFIDQARRDILDAYFGAIARKRGIDVLDLIPSPDKITSEVIARAKEQYVQTTEGNRAGAPTEAPMGGSTPRSDETGGPGPEGGSGKAKSGTDSPGDLNAVYSGGFLDPALFKRLFPDIAERTAQWAGDTKTPGDDQRAMMRETRGQMDRRVAIAIFKLRGAAKEWRTRPRAESIDFWNAVENGRIGSLSPKDQALAQVFKAAFDQMRGDLQKLKPEALQNYIENYFPHIWERSSQVTSTIKGMLNGKKPFAGKGGFLKRRTIPTMQDGLDLGFVPKSWNPVDLFVLKYAEMAQFLMGHQTLEVMKESGTAKFVRIGQKAPEGFTQLDDKIATVYRRVKVLDDDKLDDVTQPLTYPGGKRKIPGAFSEDIEDATHGELALVGHYYAPADAARVFNNFVSRGIAGRSGIYDTLRWLNDNLNGLQLGISAFHATVTTVNAAASDIALGIEQLMQGKPVKAGASMVSGAAILPTLYRTIRNGSRLMREYLSPGSHAKMEKEADAFAEAGGRVKQNTIELKPLDKAINAFRNGAFLEGLSAVPGALLHAAVAPVMDYYVPRMKVGAFYGMAHNILDEAQRKNWTPELTRARLQEAWDSIDDRFGQVVYDNLFWHKGLRDTLHLAVRAVGYTYGDIRTYGGAVKDTAKAAVQIGQGKKPRVTPRMAFAVGSFISTALLGGVMTLAWTGHAPQTWKDYTHPMDNAGQRHTIPGYPDQMISAAHDPIQWSLNKVAPIWSAMAEVAKNTDFNHTEIRHKDDPAIQQLAEVAEWAIKQPIPFSFSNTGKLLEDRGAMPTLGSMLQEAKEHPGDIALGNLGFTPAPSFVQHSEALNKAYTYERENMPPGTKTKEQAERQQAMHSLRSMFASGKVDRQKIAALKAQGVVNERDLLKARLTSKTDPLVRVVKSLTPEQALNVWNAADAKERKELRSTIEEKSRDIYTKIGNPEKRRELQTKYREALRPTVQVRPGSA